MAPSRRYPLLQYLKVESDFLKELDSILKQSSKELGAQIAAAAGKNPLTIAQLRAQQAAINAYTGKNWKSIEDLINRGQAAAAAEASRVVSEYESSLLKAIMTTDNIDSLIAAEAHRAASGVRTLMDRAQGSHRPLSEAVYGTKNIADGQIDRAINVALAQGMTNAEFAKYISKWISPDVPGGMSYAAKRLARTEINNAFHESTNKRYRESGMVEDVNWHLSTSHPEGDECDGLKADGPYDPDNVPDKPHPLCLCFTTAGLPDREEFMRKLFNGDYGDEPWVDDVVAVKPPATGASSGIDFGKKKVGKAGDFPTLSHGQNGAGAAYRYSVNNEKGGFRAWNPALRSGDLSGLSKADLDDIDELTAALRAQSLDEDRILTRNSTMEAFGLDTKKMKPSEWWDALKDTEGKTFVDDAFMSTSYHDDKSAAALRKKLKGAKDDGPELVNGKVYVRVLAPKGSQGADITKISPYGDKEKEFLFPPGTQVTVNKVYTVGNEQWVDVYVNTH